MTDVTRDLKLTRPSSKIFFFVTLIKATVNLRKIHYKDSQSGASKAPLSLKIHKEGEENLKYIPYLTSGHDKVAGKPVMIKNLTLRTHKCEVEGHRWRKLKFLVPDTQETDLDVALNPDRDRKNGSSIVLGGAISRFPLMVHGGEVVHRQPKHKQGSIAHWLT